MTGGNSSTSGEPSSCMKQDRRNSLTEERKAATAWETERRQSGVQKKLIIIIRMNRICQESGISNRIRYNGQQVEENYDKQKNIS